MRIIIPGDPIPKARARVTRKGFAYDPQSREKEKTRKFLSYSVKEFYKKSENRQEGHKLAHGEAFNVDWCFYLPIPKSFNQIKKNACKWGFVEHTTKPDRSNLEKFYEDCANGILWHDDSQITKGQIIKKYCNDDNPRTEIYMTPVPKVREDIKNIVSLFSPQEIADICWEASQLNVTEEALPRISCFISKIADNHAPKFAKIKKTYPGHWKKLE